MLIRVIDFETTGLDESAGVVEIGWCDIAGETIKGSGSAICDPGFPIPPEASAIHHITDEHVKGFRGASSMLADLAGADVYVAHNSRFDRQFADPLNRSPWICTLKAARRVWPDAPSHGNQVLRYWLGINLPAKLAEPAHRAGPDAVVTAHLLLRLMDHASVEEMIAWEAMPSILPKMPFGKHKGERFSEVPKDYLGWIVRQHDIDPDVKFTAEAALQEAAA
ncbi:MAG: DUF3820 family protein [Pseudomonadota bacterium]